MKASDYIAAFLASKQINAVFGMSGGAILHTVDSLYHNNDIVTFFTTNEQFAAFEADGYARANNCEKPGVCFATSGPGATNLLTGIATSYFDSIPIIAITGQVSTKRLSGNNCLRQLGFQEVNIIDMVRPISKGAFQPKHASELESLLPFAYDLAMSRRQGPVLIDLPDDIQREIVRPSSLPSTERFSPKNLASVDIAVVELISAAKRPLILIGNGARYAIKDLNEFVTSLNLPVVSSWAAIDVISSSKNYLGTIGTYSPRLNFLFDQCDLLISLGCRLSNNIIGSIGKDFAPQASKIVVDIDEAELEKSARIGLVNVIKVHSDVKTAILEFSNILNIMNTSKKKDVWWRVEQKNNVIPSRQRSVGGPQCLDSIEPLVRKVADIAYTNNIDVYVDTGNTLAWVCNAISAMPFRPRLFSSWNNTPMGYSLPASIGASVSITGRPRTVFCFIGDGGLSLCMSELVLLNYHRLPIKVFVVENGGHNIQKQTIETWLSGRYAGVSVDDGLAMPKFQHFGEVFDFETFVINSRNDLSDIEQKLVDAKPYLFRVVVDENLRSFPIVPFGRKLTDPICLN